MVPEEETANRNAGMPAWLTAKPSSWPLRPNPPWSAIARSLTQRKLRPQANFAKINPCQVNPRVKGFHFTQTDEVHE